MTQSYSKKLDELFNPGSTSSQKPNWFNWVKTKFTSNIPVKNSNSANAPILKELKEAGLLSRKALLEANHIWPMPAGLTADVWVHQVREAKLPQAQAIELLQNESIYRRQQGDQMGAQIVEAELKSLFRKVASSSIANYWGLSFEQFCMKNLDQILEALKIDPGEVLNFGPYFRQASRSKQGASGIQIDLLIQRQGHVLTLVECKFKEDPVGLSVSQEVDQKIKLLHLPAKVSIEKVLISPSGITTDLAQDGYFNQVLGLDIFF